MRKRLAIIILFVCRSIFSFAQYFETDTTFIPFKKGDKFVYCNPKGKVLINTRFDYAEPFSSGFAIVGKKDAKRDLLYGVIDKKGKLVLPEKFEDISFKESETEVNASNRNGLFFSSNWGGQTFNINGVKKYISENIYTTSLPGGAYVNIFLQNGKYGAVAFGDTTIRPQYDFLEQPTLGLIIFIAVNNAKKGIITGHNQELVPIVYERIEWSDDLYGFILRQEDPLLLGYYYYNTASGPQVVVPCKYRSFRKRIGDRFLLAERQDGSLVYVNVFTAKEYQR